MTDQSETEVAVEHAGHSLSVIYLQSMSAVCISQTIVSVIRGAEITRDVG